MNIDQNENVLKTSIGDFPLKEYRIGENGTQLRVLHIDTILSREQESEYLLSNDERLPYGTMLWASSIALAHDIASRDDFRGTAVLELGAGTGLPGIAAASKGAEVTQTDVNDVALELARRNLQINGLKTVRQRKVDWANWDDERQYETIIGSDILYSAEMHPHLRTIFESNLIPGGRLLISDPFRATSLKFLETLENSGWSIDISKWNLGNDKPPRSVGVFEITRPATS